MEYQIHQQVVSSLDTGLDALLADWNEHWEGIDCWSHNAIGVVSTLHASEQNGAEDDVQASGEPGQHLRPRQVEDTGCADIEPPCAGAQAHSQIAIQSQMGFINPATV